MEEEEGIEEEEGVTWCDSHPLLFLYPLLFLQKPHHQYETGDGGDLMW